MVFNSRDAASLRIIFLPNFNKKNGDISLRENHQNHTYRNPDWIRRTMHISTTYKKE